MTILHGDNRAILPTLAPESFDAVVTDPPYELGFMGKSWDKSGIAYDVGMWKEVLRVLKPGAHLLAFSGTRTYHRMVCAIEDAGFEIRDQIAWTYGSGMPKSLNVAKAIESGGGRPEDIRRMSMGDSYAPSGRGRVNYDHGGGSAMNGSTAEWAPTTEDGLRWHGWGTSLKPAWEPIVVARKPFKGTVAGNVLKHGTGAINIDACRVAPTGESRPRLDEASQDTRYTQKGATNFAVKPGVRDGTVNGRWPANFIHDGSDEVVALFPESSVTGKRSERSKAADVADTKWLNSNHQSIEYTDSGSAARFFYCAKASKADRAGSKHPTVKPQELMRYLCRLVTQPGGSVLDPFAGSGATLYAALSEGLIPTGIEMSDEYVAHIGRRLGEIQTIAA